MKARWGFLFSICENLAKFGHRLEIIFLGAKFGNMAKKEGRCKRYKGFFGGGANGPKEWRDLS
jgi:hypothetical protein